MKNFERPPLKIEGAPPNRVPSTLERAAKEQWATTRAKDANRSPIRGAPDSDSSIPEAPSHSGNMLSLSHQGMVDQGYGRIVAILQERGLLGNQAADERSQYPESQNAKDINALQRNQSLAGNAFMQKWKQQKFTNQWRSRPPAPLRQWSGFTPGTRPKPGIVSPQQMRRILSFVLDLTRIPG